MPVPRMPALSHFIAKATGQAQRRPMPRYLLHHRNFLECPLHTQNLTTRSPNILKIKPTYNMTVLLKVMLKETRNPNNAHALRYWRIGSSIETLTFRKCFATMDEMDCW